MTYTSRRTPAQWQALVEQWRQSDQSAKRFCEQNSIGYASFCKWRKRMGDEGAQPEPGAAAPFIDLGALQPGARSWKIVLSLGNGVELSLSQD